MLKKNRGYKYRLKPNNAQKIYLEKAFGCCRKMYNIYVDLLYTQLEQLNFVSGKIDYKSIDLPTPATIKKGYEYMKEIDSLAFANLQLGFQGAIKKYNSDYDGKTYSKRALKQSKTINRQLTYKDLKGMPNFKSKKRNQNSYTTNNQGSTVTILDDNIVKIPKLKEPIKFVNHRQLPQDSVIKGATVSKDCRNHYYISLLVEYYIEERQTPSKNILGLDYSQQNFYVSSEESEKANYPQYYRIQEAKLKLEQQRLSNKVLDRDYNASLNIREVGSTLLAW